MDWPTYRALCDRGDVLSRWLLEHTAQLLEACGEGRLARSLSEVPDRGEPLPRPVDHRGGPETDFFELDAGPGPGLEEIRRIAGIVARLAAEPGRRLPGGRGLGGMSEAWAECVAWLDGSHPRSPLRREEGED